MAKYLTLGKILRRYKHSLAIFSDIVLLRTSKGLQQSLSDANSMRCIEFIGVIHHGFLDQEIAMSDLLCRLNACSCSDGKDESQFHFNL